MKIELIKQRIIDEDRYKFMPITYCCEELEHNGAVYLTDGYLENEIPYMAICETKTYSDWEDKWTQDYYYPIKFCPFCGELIEVCIIKEEDLTERYKKLEEERRSLCKRIDSTDSKKEQENLLKEYYLINDKIDELDRLGEYHG